MLNLFILFEDYKDDPNCPKKFSDLPLLEKNLRKRGYKEAADWIENWRLAIQYHMEAEWDDRITSNS